MPPPGPMLPLRGAGLGAPPGADIALERSDADQYLASNVESEERADETRLMASRK